MVRLNVYLLAAAVSIIVLSCKDDDSACTDPSTCPVQRIEWIDSNNETFQEATMTYDESGSVVGYNVEVGEALSYSFNITRSEEEDLITAVSSRSDGFESSVSYTSRRYADSIVISSSENLVITLVTQDNQLIAYKEQIIDGQGNANNSSLTYRPGGQVIASQSNEVRIANSTVIDLWRYDYAGETTIAPPLPFNPVYGWSHSNIRADLVYLVGITAGPTAPASHISYDTPGSEGQLLSTTTTTNVADNTIDITYDQHGQGDNYTIRLYY